MFEHDRSASRGEMSCRGLYMFRHDNPLGNAPAHRLFERVKIKKNIPEAQPPRALGEYDVIVDREALPAGVTLEVRAA